MIVGHYTRVIIYRSLIIYTKLNYSNNNQKLHLQKIYLEHLFSVNKKKMGIQNCSLHRAIHYSIGVLTHTPLETVQCACKCQLS